MNTHLSRRPSTSSALFSGMTPRILGAQFFALLTLLLAVHAHAATKTWGGSASGFWTNAVNWAGGVAPVNGDGLIFPTNVTRVVTTNTVGGATNLLFLQLSGSNYVIFSPSLSITNGLTNSPPFAGASNRLNAAITVRANQTWVGASRTILTLASNLSLSTFQLSVDAAGGVVEAEGNVTGLAGSVLLKDGSSRLELNGPANSLPDLRVRAGTLLVDGVLAGGLSISNGATLNGNGTVPPFTNAGTVSPGFPSTGILTVSSGTATFNSGSAFQVQLNGSTTPGTDYDQLKVSTPPNLSDASLGVALGAGYSPLVGESFVIITNTGASAFTTTFTNRAEGSTFTLSNRNFTISYIGGSGNDVTLTVAGYNFTGTTRTWSGAGTNSLWLNKSNWVGNVAPGQGDDLFFPGGTARLTSTNDFPSGSVFNSITISNDFYILNGSALRINNGVHTYSTPTADLKMPLTLTQQQTFSSTDGSTRFFGPITNAGHALIFQVDSSLPTSLESTAIVSGTGGLNKAGSGILTVNSPNTFTGLAVVNQGVLVLQNATGLAPGGVTAVLAGAELDLGNNITVAEPITLVGTLRSFSGTNVLTGAITLSSANSTVQVETNSALTFSNVLNVVGNGVGGLVKTGPGTLTLAGTNANTYSAATVVNEGTLRLNKPAGTNAIPGELIIGDGVGGNNADVVQLLASNQIANSAAVTINSSGLLNLDSFDETIGPLTMDGGTLNTSGGTLTLNGDVTSAASAVTVCSSITGKLSLGGTNRTFNINTNLGALAMDISAVISDGAGSAGLTKTGPGILLLGGINIYTGPTVIAAGTLTATTGGGLGTSAGGTVVSNGAILRVAANITLDELAVTLFGTLQNFSETNVFTGTITLASSNTTVQVDGDQLTFSGALAGSDGLVKNGPGVLQLSGSTPNSFFGNTTVNAGTLLLNKSAGTTAIPGPLLVVGDGTGGANADMVRSLANHQISDSTLVTLKASGLLDLNGFTETIGSLAGVSGASLTLGSGALTTGGNNNSTAFAGIISGSGGRLTKAGSGTMTLSGNNTHTGPTFATAGTLLVNGSQPGSTAQVNGGILGGTGTVGIINAFSGSSISPGASPGILTSSNVTFSASSFFTVELNGTNADTDYDQLNVTGTVNVFNSTLNGTVGFTPALSNSFVIINNDGAEAVFNTFSNRPNGSVFAFGGFPFQISYTGGSGNDVVLTRIRPAASITNATQAGTNFQFQGLGVAGINYVVEASTNLLNWSPVSTNTADSGGLFTFTQTNASQFPQRYFRAVTP